MYIYGFKSDGLQKTVMTAMYPINKGRIIAKSEKVLAAYNEKYAKNKTLQSVFVINIALNVNQELSLKMDKPEKIAYKQYFKHQETIKQ
jgi:hypothetical protein